MDEKWHYGIWVGKTEVSDENVVLTKDGMLLDRTVHVVNDEDSKTMQHHLLVKDLPWDAKETAKKNEESPVDRQDEPVRLPKGVPATQQLHSAVQADVTCPACKGRHRAHTKQAGCRLYEETKVGDENLKETPKDATMTASSLAATD